MFVYQRVATRVLQELKMKLKETQGNFMGHRKSLATKSWVEIMGHRTHARVNAMVDGGYTGFCLVGGLAYFPNRKSTRTGESIYI